VVDCPAAGGYVGRDSSARKMKRYSGDSSMARALAAPVVVLVSLASCATISGLADKEAVDCPGGCDEAGLPGRSDGSTLDASTDLVVDTGPPKCDPSTNPECVTLPEGWSFAPRAPLAGGEAPPCPSGTTNASVVQESPTTQAATCTCDTCTVTAPATCSGQVTYSFQTGFACTQAGDPTHYKNVVAGNCYQDLYTGIWAAEQNRFTLPNPSGGACAVNPTAHADRVTYGERSALCEGGDRCSGGFCDVRVDAPFAVCVARTGDEACPQGFPTKHVVGTGGADFDCGTCSCALTRQPCQGAVHHYDDSACTAGEVIIPANGTCGGPNTDGANFDSYKVVATSTTTCDTSGNTTATNARMKNPRTVCCR
jgi:hypothetical protein